MKGKGREDVEGKGDVESGEELGGKGGRTDRSDQMKKRRMKALETLMEGRETIVVKRQWKTETITRKETLEFS